MEDLSSELRVHFRVQSTTTHRLRANVPGTVCSLVDCVLLDSNRYEHYVTLFVYVFI